MGQKETGQSCAKLLIELRKNCEADDLVEMIRLLRQIQFRLGEPQPLNIKATLIGAMTVNA